MISDTIASLSLLFTRPLVILLITLIAALREGRSFFFQTGPLIFFSIIVNVALKAFFKIPLSPSLGVVGFAFPSGHMQLATVFYGWILLRFPYGLCRIPVLVLLLCIAAALVHYGYHNIPDILGALVSGIVIITAYSFALKKWDKNLHWGMLALATALMLYSEHIYQTMPHAHALIAYGLLWTFIVIEKMVLKIN